MVENALAIGVVWESATDEQGRGGGVRRGGRAGAAGAPDTRYVNATEYAATRAYLASDAAATIADADFVVTPDARSWWGAPWSRRSTAVADYMVTYVGPEGPRTQHKLAQVIANVVFAFGDALTFAIDHRKRHDMRTRDTLNLDSDVAHDVTRFANSAARAFERLPIVIWSDTSRIVHDFRKFEGPDRSANWTLATKDPAADDFGPSNVLSPLPPRHFPTGE